jgi:transcriptional regulator with XRE-family HTH domain
MSQSDENASMPQSMRHKQILDVAADNPDASMSELASMVPSATPELVERVLEEYGDPASADDDTAEMETAATTEEQDESSESEDQRDHETMDPTETSEEPGSTSEETVETADELTKESTTSDEQAEEDTEQRYPSPEELTEKQRTTLRAVTHSPDVTQRELAEELDVSRATISNRLNDIDGFDWADRETFVSTVFGEVPDNTEDTMATEQDERQNAMEEFDERIAAIETKLASVEETESSAVFDDPELAHKVVHACMQADTISEDEELRILKSIIEE